MGTTAMSPRSNFKRLLEALMINPMRCFLTCKSKKSSTKILKFHFSTGAVRSQILPKSGRTDSH